MAYGTISNEWLNRNNLETLWAAIVRDFVHAGASSVSGGDGGTTKGSMLYWGQTSTPTGPGQPIQPSHLQIGGLGQFLGVSDGIPEWTTPQLQQAGGAGNTPLTLYLKDAASVALSLQTAGASQWGIITDQAQTLGGEKTFNETIKGKKNIEADWGVSAEGIADLSLSSGGGGGTVTRLIICGTQYDPESGVITVPTASLQSDLGLGSAAYKNVGVVASGNLGLVTGNDVSSAINEALTAAMKIEGETTTNVKDYPSANPVVIDGQSVTAYKGMVVFYNSKEFVWTGSSWKELGDESSFALKTTTITGTGYLTGGGSLAESRTLDISDAVKGKINTAYSHATDSGRLTTAQTSGLYKFSVTSEGHIGGVAVMTENDITGLISNTLGTITSSIGQVYTIAQDNSENITLHDGRLSDLESYFDGNVALYAERFSSERTISLTGHVIGSASSDGLSGWSIASTISNNVIENGMIKDDTIQNAKLVNKGVTINGTYAALGESKTTEYWGTARDIQITDADDTNEGVATSVNGSQNYKLALPTNLKVGTLLSTEGITSNKNIQAGWGVAAYGIADLALSAGGGSGTVTAIIVNGTQYDPVGGFITLPNYPSLDGYATQQWVSGQITALSLGTASTHAHEDYVTGITWDSTNRKLKQTKGSNSATDIVQFGTVYSHGHDEYLTDLGTSGNTLTWSKGGVAQQAITVPYATNAGQLGGVALGGLFTVLENSSKQLSATIGGVNKKLTLDYAKKSTALETEPLTDQEFIFRNSPQTIGADSLKLDRIFGKTLAWNQILNNGEITATGTAESTAWVNTTSGKSIISGHKYIVHVQGTGFTLIRFRDSSIDKTFGSGAESFIFTADASATAAKIGLYVTVGNYSAKQNIHDLTLMFGAGNEPSTVAEFEALYPNAYYEYNAGQLINNSAKGLETVGFNLWDEEWEAGQINDNGNNANSSNRIRSKNFIPVISNSTYYFTMPAAAYVVRLYDSGKNFLGTGSVSSNTLAIPSGVSYIRFHVGSSAYILQTYNHDICINLSDSSRNGQYEPYKRNVLDLHLEEFKVKDSQGNIITITGGLKQAGSVRDEIVGGKYIRRVGDVDLGSLTWTYFGSNNVYYSDEITGRTLTSNIIDDRYIISAATSAASMTDKSLMVLANKRLYVRDSAFNNYSGSQVASALSGSIAQYELATPVEYELVEPIPTAMPAGTTERRLPEDTSDSVLAPFACDMTYGTNPGDILTDVIGLDTKFTSILADINIKHYQSAQSSPVDTHVIQIGDKKLYLRFSSINGDGSQSGTLPSFTMAVADNDRGENEQTFSFGTITEQWILDNCKLS